MVDDADKLSNLAQDYHERHELTIYAAEMKKSELGLNSPGDVTGRYTCYIIRRWKSLFQYNRLDIKV